MMIRYWNANFIYSLRINLRECISIPARSDFLERRHLVSSISISRFRVPRHLQLYGCSICNLVVVSMSQNVRHKQRVLFVSTRSKLTTNFGNANFSFGQYVGQKTKGYHDKPSTSLRVSSAPVECRRRPEWQYG